MEGGDEGEDGKALGRVGSESGKEKYHKMSQTRNCEVCHVIIALLSCQWLTLSLTSLTPLQQIGLHYKQSLVPSTDDLVMNAIVPTGTAA